jgi:hypothetical protein
MIEPDEELRRALHLWEAPKPDPSLDARVRKARRRTRGWKWLPIAAGFVLAAGIAAYWPSARRMDMDGFRPLPNGAITVIRIGEQR